MNLIKELASRNTALVLAPAAKYHNAVTQAAKQLSGKRTLYITLNKTCNSLLELFAREHIDTRNFLFLDAISERFTDPLADHDQCQSVTAGSLTELATAISDALEADFDYLIFDSITNLFVYRKTIDVHKFLAQIISNVKQHPTKALFFAIEEEDTLLRDISASVDTCITLESSAATA